jgi:predicted house-cleaning noncanonical NTP pyrophosphatase (MazG superfamily)
MHFARTSPPDSRALAVLPTRVSLRRWWSIFWIERPCTQSAAVPGDQVTRKLYDKLVPDRIPEIIQEAGSTCGTEIHSDESAFRRALRDKLVEEAREAANSSEEDLATELADLQEVVDALIAASGLNLNVLRALQEQRRPERGAFFNRIRLLWTE